jgi:hypothetical protein
MTDMTELQRLIAHRAETEEAFREAGMVRARAFRAITAWGKEQVERALSEKGIILGKSVVRMKIRRTRKGRTVLEVSEVLFDGVGLVTPPTMERGALGPHAASTEMWWTAYVYWQNVRKDGKPGASGDFCIIHGDTVEELVANIEHVRDLA